jgi:hypothetical protein
MVHRLIRSFPASLHSHVMTYLLIRLDMALPFPIISVQDNIISAVLYSTGDALETANAHAGEADVTFGSSFVHSCRESGSRLSTSNGTVEVALLVDIQCGSLPFVQTTFSKQEELLEVSPKGLVF